jgi:hypothetical protein
MIRYLHAVTLGFVSVAVPLCAANRPHVGTDGQNAVVWTNDDLARLHGLGLISIVGRVNDETSKSESLPQSDVNTQDPSWYDGQAARLRDELGRSRTELDRYSQAIEAARSLETMTGGINLNDGDIGITPEASIEILQQRVSETQTQLDALEDLARRNDMQPGTLRGQ